MSNGISVLTLDDLLMRMFIEDELRDVQQGNEGEPVTSATSVYRVEMANGRGPFNYNDDEEHDHRHTYDKMASLCNVVMADPNHNHEQMGVTEAAFKAAHGHAAYGCDSLESVDLWFPRSAREYIKSLGGKLVHYEIQPGDYIYRVGQGEVVFSKPAARLVETLDLVETFHA